VYFRDDLPVSLNSEIVAPAGYNCVNGSVLNESDPILQKYASHHAYQTAINLKQSVFAPKCSLGLFRILLGRMTEFIDCDIAKRLNKHAHS
jgi:hypothetical protein